MAVILICTIALLPIVLLCMITSLTARKRRCSPCPRSIPQHLIDALPTEKLIRRFDLHQVDRYLDEWDALVEHVQACKQPSAAAIQVAQMLAADVASSVYKAPLSLMCLDIECTTRRWARLRCLHSTPAPLS